MGVRIKIPRIAVPEVSLNKWGGLDVRVPRVEAPKPSTNTDAYDMVQTALKFKQLGQTQRENEEDRTFRRKSLEDQLASAAEDRKQRGLNAQASLDAAKTYQTTQAQSQVTALKNAEKLENLRQTNRLALRSTPIPGKVAVPTVAVPAEPTLDTFLKELDKEVSAGIESGEWLSRLNDKVATLPDPKRKKIGDEMLRSGLVKYHYGRMEAAKRADEEKQVAAALKLFGGK